MQDVIKRSESRTEKIGSFYDEPKSRFDKLDYLRKNEIETVVKKIVNEYGEALRLLGRND